MKKLLRFGGVAALISVLMTISAASSAGAASVTSSGGSGNGYRIFPVRSDITVSPGGSQIVTIYVQNISTANEDIQVVLNDFQARADESGAPALLLNGQSASQHGLKQYMSASPATFSLAPGQQQTIAVHVTIPAKAAGGGYFGALRVAPASLSGDKSVNLAASVASLILAKVPGYITERLSIAGLDVTSNGSPHIYFTNDKGLEGAVRFQNSGNIQEEPFGKLQLKKGSKVLHTYEVNNTDPAGNVLPDSIRKFTVALGSVGSFGKYQLVGNFGYGSTGQLLSASTTFYIVPLAVFVLVVVIILFILFLIFGLPRLVRRYNQRILRRGRA